MKHRIAAAGVALAHLFPVALVAVVVFLAGCQAFSDGETSISTPIGVSLRHEGPPAPPAPQVVDDGIHALMQQFRPTKGAGRVDNGLFCDAIEADGYKAGHATHQLYCLKLPDAPQAPTVSVCPDQHPDLAACQTQLMDAAERGDRHKTEVDRLNRLINGDYANDLRKKANEIERLQNKMALLINPTDCRPLNAAGTELRCPNPEGVSDE